MAKMYTLDKKLLIGSPTVVINEKVYPVDDRAKTVKKVVKLSNQLKDDDKDFESVDEIFKLAFGENFREIDELDLSFKAYLELVDIVIDAMTSGDPEEYEKKKEQEKADTFRPDSAE